MTELSQTALLRELEPVVAKNLDRHLAVAKEWFPHEYVPWSEGRDFDGLLAARRGTPSDSHDARRRPHGADRQPADRGQPARRTTTRSPPLFGRDGAWGTWVHRWTAEEGRHGIAIRDYLTGRPGPSTRSRWSGPG